MFKSTLINQAVLTALMLSVPSISSAVEINLAAQPLDQAITQLGKTTNVIIGGDSLLLKGKSAPAITGDYSAEQALQKLLGGSGLTAIKQANGSYVIKKHSNDKIVGTLATTKVGNDKSEGSGSYTTEGSGSYTTESMSSATGLNLSIRNTPQSVSVITNQEIEDKGITSLQGLLEQVAGVSIYRWDERIYTSARGFDVDHYKLDGIPRLTKVESRNDDLSIFDRIELVRGANGLITGAGNPGISINFVRKKANSKALEGSASLTANSFGAASLETDVSSKLNSDGTIRGRVVVKHEEGDTHLDDYKFNNNLIYGVISADLTDTTKISVGASWQTTDADYVRSGGLSAYDNNGDLINWDVTDHFSEDWTYSNDEAKEVFVEIDQVLFNDIKLNINYLHGEVTRDVALINFAGNLDIATGEGTKYYTWKSENLEVSDGVDINVDVPFTIGGLDQQVIIGASYSKDNLDKYYSNYDVTDLDNFYGYDISAPTYQLEENTVPEYVLQKAVFISSQLSLNEQLKLIAGARLSSWEYESTDSENESRKFSGELTPYIGLVQDIDDNHSIYASYTSIFNPQNFKDVNGDYLDPVTGKNYEAGIKGEYFNSKLNASLSLFRIQQEGVAEVTDIERIDNPLLNAYRAAEGVTSKGFEIDINGNVTDNLNLGLGIANFEAKDAEGEYFNTKNSRTTANIFARYIINKDLTVGAGLRYKSKFYISNDSVTQDAFYLANIMANYRFNKEISLQFNIHNLFDKKYYVGLTTSEYTYGSPRKIIAKLKYTF
jgi:outer membrane receptor for ferric coprogen and ferric-rhodotorulic acid